ncbi:LysR family transcriptional regulator [Caballeronia fortuita]|uniref:LysR family transcriptional regulator n=2 Tax=Caballeronia fortuita TaxID=1777138 RepID=A0A158CTX1_9BURK|nr:LysR family transcriptional regulator [Caballeronia fortuita]
MVPTRRAVELAPQINDALARVSNIFISESQVDANIARRTFNIALSDDIEACISPMLINEARVRKLSVGFAFHQSNSIIWKESLSDDAIDLVLCGEPKGLGSHFSSKVLFSASYSCLYDGVRLGIQSPITRDEYLSHDHVRISYDGRRGFVDDLLEADGVTRKVSASFTHFAGAIASLVYCDAIATIPTFAANAYARIARLTVSPPPITVPAFRVFMIWNVARNEGVHNQWLRSFVSETTRELQYGASQPQSPLRP